MKKFILIVLVIMLITFSLTGCTLFQKIYDEYQEFMQPYYEDMDLAQEYAEQFIYAVANDDFESARQYLHPDLIASEYDLEKQIAYFEERYRLDFSDGVVIEDLIGTKIAIGSFDSEYSVGFNLLIGNEELQLYFIAERTDNGFGIFIITEVRPSNLHYV
ncbi:MAG: hypothetical protein ACI3XL_04805 [Eubacteriales bacterium]